MNKSPDAFRTISEVADHLETPAHVLRFWESRFPQIRPVKRAGGRRYYRPSDIALLTGIKRLLHDEGMTIRGVQKILREHGVRHVAGLFDETPSDEAMVVEDAVAQSRPEDVAAIAAPEVEAPPEPAVEMAPPQPEPVAALEEPPKIGTQAVLPFPPMPAREPAAKAVAEAPAARTADPEEETNIASRIRALPPGSLMAHQAEVAALCARLSRLRAMLASHTGTPRP
ncbi:MAG: MerR family transcriptional regulator [Tabrizicola sp.]|nr:MerR family transcriptional regulator [Tabrizicola sp.]